MKTINLLFLSVLIAIVTWSCSSPASSNGEFGESPYAKATEISPVDSLSDLAQQIPGFGGLFIDDSGQLTIYLTDPDQQQAKAKEVLSNSELIAQSLSHQSASVSDMQVLKGQYTFITLHEWKKEVSRKVLIIEGVHSAGIDQSRNKLSIGVENESVLDKVHKKLAELDIPEEAVIIYQMTPPRFY